MGISFGLVLSLLAAERVAAGPLSLSFEPSSVSVARGQTATISIRIINSDTTEVYLNGVETTLPAVLGGESATDPLVTAIPEFLGPGEAWTGSALLIAATPSAPLGTEPHSIALYGGGESTSHDVLATGFFQVTVVDSPCPAYLTSHPKSVEVTTGQLATFEASHPSIGTTWQWSRNGVPLADGPVIAGAQSAKLTLQAAIRADTGTYVATATTPCGTFTSLAARLEVLASCTAPPAFLAAWWPFDSVHAGSQPDLAHRTSGRNTLVLAGGAAITAGLAGGGLACLSPTAAATAAPGSSPDLDFGAGSFSLLAWVRPTSTATPGTARAILSRRTVQGAFSRGFALFLDGKRLGFLQGDGTSQTVVYATSDLDTSGGWHHAGVVVDRGAGQARFYVDGLDAGHAALPSLFVTSIGAALVVGGASPGGSGLSLGAFLGALDEPLVAQYAADPGTIRRIAAAGSDGLCRRVLLAPSIVSVSSTASGARLPGAVASTTSDPIGVEWSSADAFDAECQGPAPLMFFPAVGSLNSTIETRPPFESQVLLPQPGAGTYCYAIAGSIGEGTSLRSSGRIHAGRRPVHARTLNAVPELVSMEGSFLHYRIYNDSASPVTLLYQVEVEGRDRTWLPGAAQIDGAGPGFPAAGSAAIAAHDSTDILLSIRFPVTHPFAWFDVTLRDAQGDAATSALASTIVGTVEDEVSGNPLGVEDSRFGERTILGPNPFRSSTVLQFSVAQRQRVEADVYDVTGARVRSLMRGELEPGRHSLRWDGHDRQGKVCAPGVYFVRLARRGANETLKVVRLR